MIPLKEEIIRIDLRKSIGFPYPMINNAAEGLHEIADKRLAVIKESMMHPAISIKAIQGKQGFHKIEQVSIPDIQQQIRDILLATGRPAFPVQIAEINFEKKMTGSAFLSHQQISLQGQTGRKMFLCIGSHFIQFGNMTVFFQQCRLIADFLADQAAGDFRRPPIVKILFPAEHRIAFRHIPDNGIQMEIAAQQKYREPIETGLFQDDACLCYVANDKKGKGLMTGMLQPDVFDGILYDQIIGTERKFFLFGHIIENDLFVEKIRSRHHDRTSSGQISQISL